MVGIKTVFSEFSMSDINSWKICHFIDDKTAAACIDAELEIVEMEIEEVDDCHDAIQNFKNNEEM